MACSFDWFELRLAESRLHRCEVGGFVDHPGHWVPLELYVSDDLRSIGTQTADYG